MTLHRAPTCWGELAKGLRGAEPAYTLVFNPFMRGEAKIQNALPISSPDWGLPSSDSAPMMH